MFGILHEGIKSGHDLGQLGSFGRAELSAMGAIVDYLNLTQRGKLPLLRPPVRERAGGAMQIDAATRRNLELTQALSGGREGSLLSAIDRTTIERDTASFAVLTWSALGLLCVGLVGAVVFQVRFGLRPLHDLEAELVAVRRGKVQRLSGQYNHQIT